MRNFFTLSLTLVLCCQLYGKDNINTAKLALNYAALLNDTEEFKRHVRC